MRFYDGIIAIDPSWNGFALAAFIPELGLEVTELYTLNDGTKNYTKPKKTIDSLFLVLADLVWRMPWLKLCDKIVVEGQFKSNMKTLQWITIAMLRVFWPDAKIDTLSALRAKRILGIELKESHWSNKKEAVKFVESNQNILCAKLHDLNDNKADAIILLNAYLEDKPMSKRPWTTMQTEDNCQNCGQALVKKTAGQASKSPGREYMACTNNLNDAQCKKSFKWLDEPAKRVFKEPDISARLDKLEHLMMWIAEQIEKMTPEIQE